MSVGRVTMRATPPMPGVIWRSTAYGNASRVNSASLTVGYGEYRAMTATLPASVAAVERRFAGSSLSKPSDGTPRGRTSTDASSSSVSSGISSVNRAKRGLFSSGWSTLSQMTASFG